MVSYITSYKTQQIKFGAIFQHCLQLHLLISYQEILLKFPATAFLVGAKTLGGSLTMTAGLY